VDKILWMGVLCLVRSCVHAWFFTHMNEMHGSRSKIPIKKLVSNVALRDLIPALKGQSP
jgi:heme/copper-type cytochrome/quinol oxidase subunit 4